MIAHPLVDSSTDLGRARIRRREANVMVDFSFHCRSIFSSTVKGSSGSRCRARHATCQMLVRVVTKSGRQIEEGPPARAG